MIACPGCVAVLAWLAGALGLTSFFGVFRRKKRGAVPEPNDQGDQFMNRPAPVKDEDFCDVPKE